ncbi:hypothetical protein RchiOBHm_Chr4g0423511 [Rosa chinensis]|uniref:Uncharacterized protein n=1 Tax=Rosa chinensis TaxID=74649 RepID=A0A2P6QYL8_ROSCH|nr:hypothetical protein RchiOBHm_Chr4g0423511 [Rosa chinensis]
MAFERFAMRDESYDERFVMRDESYGVFLNCKAPPVVSERRTIIEDCHGVQFLCSPPVAAQKVIVTPANQYLYATKDEYHGNSWPKTTSTSRPPLPHPLRGYYPQAVSMGNQVPNLTKRLEVPQTARKPITSDEAAKLFGGILITEYRTKKQHRA